LAGLLGLLALFFGLMHGLVFGGSSFSSCCRSVCA
jgi:hypothetical protein